MIPISIVDQHAARHPTRTALVDDYGAVSWHMFADCVNQWVQVLATRLNPNQENRAVLIGENQADYVMAVSALASLGIPWVGLDPFDDPNVLVNKLREVSPTVIFATTGGYRQVADAIPTLSRPPLLAGLSRGGMIDFCSPVTLIGDLKGGSRAVIESAWLEQPFVSLGFTSGTTGRPKLVLRTCSSEQRRIKAFVDRYQFGPGDTHLATVPFAHASGSGWARLFLAVGATLVLTNNLDPAWLVRLAAECRVRTTLMVPPTLTQFVAGAEDAAKLDLSELRFVLTGGSPMRPKVLRRAVARLGPVISAYYGTTETGVNLIADPPDLAVNAAAVGRPIPGNHVLLLNPDRRPIRSGGIGRVAISSYMAMARYINHGASVIDHSGRRYLVTGDYGRFDADNMLVLTSRDDGLPGASSLPRIPLESELLDIPGISDAAIVRTATSKGPPEVIAALVPTVSAAREVPTKKVECVLDRYLPKLTPRRISTLPALPYNRTGKICLRTLHDLL